VGITHTAKNIPKPVCETIAVVHGIRFLTCTY
jgi:hypothetical protein